MTSKTVIVFLLATCALAGCRGSGYSIERYDQPAPPGYPGGLSGKVTTETHGRIVELPYFSSADVPAQPQVHRKTSAEPTINLAVETNQGYLSVRVLYPPFGHVNYGANGRGQAIPIAIKIEAPLHPSALLPRDSTRRYKPMQDLEFRSPVDNKRNREEAIALSKEILANTHCRGGAVTEDQGAGSFVEVYHRNSRAASGLKLVPGWLVKLRCSKWRAKG
ncbi:hypothetical protein [Roseovarius sp.]|uniref:hypothetical protein n=1 Tax=Roseovarius sp. TaxID=1486281 RepID=UPI003D11E620